MQQDPTGLRGPTIEKSEDSVNGIGIIKDEPVKKRDGGKKAQPPKKEQAAGEATFEKPKLKKSCLNEIN